MSNTKFINLDGIRGIAAIFVFLRHTGEYWGGIDFFHSYLAVDVFFILSGFVIAHAYQNRLDNGTLSKKDFFITRLIRLYPMYFLGIFLGLLLALIKLTFDIKLTLIADNTLWFVFFISLFFLPAHLGPGQTLFPLNAASWSIFYELIVNLFYGAVHRYINAFTLSAALLLSLMVVSYAAFKRGDLDIGAMAGAKSIFGASMRAGFGIFYGLLLHRLYIKGYRINLPAILQLVPIIVIAIVFTIPKLGSYNWLFDILCIAVILPICIFWAAGEKTYSYLLAPFAYLGAISYPLYALHGPISNFFSTFFMSEITASSPISGILLLIFTFSTCMLMLKLIDTPVRSWLTDCFLRKNKVQEKKQEAYSKN